ncbi:MAG TPA: hypothetical protein VMF12_00670 [Xanthobacteraceae bacterium]|nr:hypothetical protein [Xanthobacteraceae bacterium]
MTPKELVVWSAIVLVASVAVTMGTSTATLARGYYGYHHHGHHFRGLYNYYGGFARPDVIRGGPGPRVNAGSGEGIGAVR